MTVMEASSPTVSSLDSQRTDTATIRPRWKKALSIGSMKSSADAEQSQRCTDLDELDMQLLATHGTLTLNRATGGYSGWAHVATLRGGNKVTFVKRFCRLKELVCTFYVTSNVGQRVRPVGHHVIISVERVHSRNKTFAFTDYQDCTVLIHTCIGADFEHWYGTFAAIVKTTQVAKTRFVEKNRSSKAKRLQRLRTLTAPMSEMSVDLDTETLPTIRHEDLERTHTVWLYVHAPWWRHLLLRRQRVRQYFVFSGTNVSFFSVNKEGKLATFTHAISSCSYNREQDPTVVEIKCGHRKLRLSSSTADAASTVAATAAYIQRALQAAET